LFWRFFLFFGAFPDTQATHFSLSFYSKQDAYGRSRQHENGQQLAAIALHKSDLIGNQSGIRGYRMARRRIFVIWTHPIFHESVRLLLNHPDVEWIGAATDLITAQPEIFDLKPDTILVEEMEEGTSATAIKVLEDVPWNVRVVSVSLAMNKLNVFHREQKTVGQADDLLHLVLNEFS
jgi:hypothetical protein